MTIFDARRRGWICGLWGGVIVVGLLASHRAFADGPAWCGSLTHEADSPHFSDLKELKTENDPQEAMVKLVRLSCKPGNEDQAEVAAHREAWGKRLSLQSDADWADVAAWASENNHMQNEGTVKVDSRKPWRDLGPLEQFGAIIDNEEFVYITDALGPKLTETGRMAYILSCAHTIRDSGAEAEVMGHWAVCQPDIDALDRKKVLYEIRSDTLRTGFERTAMRMRLYALDTALKSRAAKIQELSSKDKAYSDLFRVAAEARRVKLDPAMVELALEMDGVRTSNSQRAHWGCQAKTDAALRAAISAIPAKTFEELHDDGPVDLTEQIIGGIMADPNGYLAGLSYFNCRWSNETGAASMWRSYMNTKLGDSYKYWFGFRGPRSAAYTALMRAGIEPDDRDTKLQIPHPFHRWMESRGGGTDAARGVVESVKLSTDGTDAVVSFKKQMVTRATCKSWRSTKRITMIRSDGQFVYEEHCTNWGSETVNLAPSPTKIAGYFAGAIKPGMVLWTRGDVAEVGWPKAGVKTPSYVLGAPVK